MSSLRDQIAALEKITSDLDGYLERRAAELAAPLIEQAEEHAAECLGKAEFEARRQADLVAELRRQLKPAIRQADQRALGKKVLSKWDRRNDLQPQTRELLREVAAALNAPVEDT